MANTSAFDKFVRNKFGQLQLVAKRLFTGCKHQPEVLGSTNFSGENLAAEGRSRSDCVYGRTQQLLVPLPFDVERLFAGCKY